MRISTLISTARDHDAMIRADLRLLGDLASQLNTDYPERFPNLETSFNDNHFGPFIESAVELLKLDKTTGLPEKGSRAERLVAICLKTIEILKADLIMSGKKKEGEELEKFNSLFKTYAPAYFARKRREKLKQDR